MSSAGIRFLGATVLVLELTGCGGGASTSTSIPSMNPPNAPTRTAFGVLGNGGVSVIVPHGGVTYIGGNFDELAGNHRSLRAPRRRHGEADRAACRNPGR